MTALQVNLLKESYCTFYVTFFHFSCGLSCDLQYACREWLVADNSYTCDCGFHCTKVRGNVNGSIGLLQWNLVQIIHYIVGNLTSQSIFFLRHTNLCPVKLCHHCGIKFRILNS